MAVYSVKESVARGLHAAFSYYLVGGNTRTLSGDSIVFPDCTLKVTIDELRKDTANKPVVAFLGSRSGAARREKCDNGYELRVPCIRTVYVKVNRNGPFTDQNGLRVSPDLFAFRLGDLITGIVLSGTKKLVENDIYVADINPEFRQEPDDEFVLMQSTMRFEYRTKYTVEVTP